MNKNVLSSTLSTILWPVLREWDFPDDGLTSLPLNVLSLLHFDGADGSTTFTDASTTTWTRTGGVEFLDTAQSKFGGSSYGGTSGGNLTSSVVNLGTADFTMEYFWRGSSSATFNYAVVTNLITIEMNDNFNGGKISYGANPASMTRADDLTFSDYQWTHVALVRIAGTLKVALNGVFSSTSYSLPGALSGSISLRTDGDTYYSHMDEFRLTAGTAIYTTNFTPPVLPFPNP